MAALETVLKQLADSGILAPGKLENFVPPKAHPHSVDELVAELVKHKELTPFQAAQIKAGKVRALILGGYTILDKIGAGGMGQVYKAQHRRMKRVVAVKMLPAAVTKDAAAVARFQREVEAAARFEHGNIVTAYDADQANGVHFLVMQYVDGTDLSALVKKNGPLPVAKAFNYILQAARGLEYAHSRGVIHRDIKPANLLLGSDGVVKILDMGLARIDQPDGPAQTELTGSGTIMGTVDFMAPEQALNSKYADHRADIYSLGLSLYYLLAGKMAYGGETAMEKLMAHQIQPIPSLLDVQTTVPKQLDAIFKQMVAKKIEDRYQSMGEVIEALETLGIGTTTTKKGEVASTLALSPEQRKKLAAQSENEPLSTITSTVASKAPRNLILKIVGGAFGAIIAPILVFYSIRHLEREDKQAAAAAAAPAASEPTGVVATNATNQPPAPVLDDGPPTPMVAPFDAVQARAGQAAWAKHLGTQVETTNSLGMRMTLIPPGEFLMGSTREQFALVEKMLADFQIDPKSMQNTRYNTESPSHRVVITKPFLLGTFEVTVGEFKKFIAATNYVTLFDKDANDSSDPKKQEWAKKGTRWGNPGYPVTDNHPVPKVHWADGFEFCNWLSNQEQRTPWYSPDGKGNWLVAPSADGYRLPTEAEWEYACRAGTVTLYSFGDDYAQLGKYGWFMLNSQRSAHPVGSKLPNPFGLYDMHGNVFEWCQDWFETGYYNRSPEYDPTGPAVTLGEKGLLSSRGGCWAFNQDTCRSAFRSYINYTGLRVVRVLDATVGPGTAKSGKRDSPDGAAGLMAAPQ